MTKKVSIRWKSAGYSVLKNLNSSVLGIFCEFIDNSIQSYKEKKDQMLKIDPNYRLKIDISYDGEEIRIKDIVLSSTHNNKDSLTEKISKVLEPKYFIKKTTGGYYASDVVYEKPKISDKAYIIQYCYTIHSVQGETVEDNQNLYIDSRNLYNSRVLYTAISRAKYARQIKFII